ncbi:unnamed protein product [Mytilus coruscus]|uniref:G-protein coupled receptors family 1 profile domain-containing protein n=1 Tax=Mytilus coruscus TaxID=42192 RepID=A0A6J8AKR3_MYTCO|nr:unnamed protein product [Mytilus coruscus]
MVRITNNFLICVLKFTYSFALRDETNCTTVGELDTSEWKRFRITSISGPFPSMFRVIDYDDYSSFVLELVQPKCVKLLWNYVKTGERFHEIPKTKMVKMLKAPTCENSTLICPLIPNNLRFQDKAIHELRLELLNYSNIYFIHSKCMASFSNLYDIEPLLTQSQLNAFLLEYSNCQRFLRLTNENNFQFTSNGHVSEDGNSSLYILHAYDMVDAKILNVKFSVQVCANEFLSHISKLTNRTILLSVSKISKILNGINCTARLDFECYNEWSYMPKEEIVYAECAIAVEILLVNTIVIVIFLKKYMSPITVWLSGLALSDLLTSISTVSLDVLGLYKPMQHPAGVLMWYWWYPSCVTYTIIRTHSFAFHLMSVLFTTVLCLHKAVAILFPFWTKRSINIKFSVVSSVVIAVSSIFILCPSLLDKCSILHELNGMCCSEELPRDIQLATSQIMYLVNLTLMAVVVFCTTFISCKLTCFKKIVATSESLAIRKKNKRSAIVILIICIIFLMSEFIQTILYVKFAMFPDFANSNEWFSIIVNFKDISLLVGYALNFIVYLLLSDRLRTIVFKGCCNVCNIFK